MIENTMRVHFRVTWQHDCAMCSYSVHQRIDKSFGSALDDAQAPERNPQAEMIAITYPDSSQISRHLVS